jgi:DNA-binding ferritin-like protein
MDKCVQTANLFLATLKAIYQIHQNNHWTASGNNFYSTHLLFQRLYEEALEDIDTTAEKFLGVFGDEAINYQLQAELVKNIILKYKDKKSFEQSLAVEKDFQKFLIEAYKCFEDEKTMTLGLDNFVQGMCDNSEHRCYLLGQSLK